MHLLLRGERRQNKPFVRSIDQSIVSMLTIIRSLLAWGVIDYRTSKRKEHPRKIKKRNKRVCCEDRWMRSIVVPRPEKE